MGLAVSWVLGNASIAGAQTADTVPRQTWSVEGVVELGKRSGPEPVANQWVVVHRIASDAGGKVSGGALDSGRTDRRGQYRVSFPHYGDARATYIAITTFAGVSYISAPLNRPRTAGDDGMIIVFDTTAPPYPLHVAGRHMVLAGPGTDDRRRVVEVYELMNDSTLTVIGTESNPVWRAPIPAGVTDLEINPQGDISPTMTKVEEGWLDVFAPISPGLRQLSFTYTLPPGAFPLAMTVLDSASVFELLVQEPDAFVEGGGFTEVAAVMQQGVPFRRFLAQEVPAGATMRFSVPKPASRIGRREVTAIASVLAGAMALALGFVFWKRRRPARASQRAADPTGDLIRELATMDAAFELRGDRTDAEVAAHAAKRAELKARLAAALAAANGRT